MKKYNVKSIMSRAWAIYHETDKGDGLRPVFSLCLAMAWEDANAMLAKTNNIIADSFIHKGIFFKSENVFCLPKNWKFK